MTEAELDDLIAAKVGAILATRPRSDIAAWLLGAAKSATVYWSAALGVIIASWPEIQAILEEQVFPLLSEEARQRWVRIFGVAVAVVGILIRQRTKTSLVSKGTTA
jgi:hypothetical protein